MKEIFKDLITIFTDNKVTSWPRETKGMNTLIKWIQDSATNFEEVEDCLLWMMDTKNKMSFSISLGSVPKALTHFEKVKKLRPDGRYEANFSNPSSRTEKDFNLLKERNYKEFANDVIVSSNEKKGFI